MFMSYYFYTFVGRCTEDISAEDLREYFTKFGEVTGNLRMVFIGVLCNYMFY